MRLQVQAASQKEVKAALEGTAFAFLKQEAELYGHAPPKSLTVPLLKAHLNVKNGYKQDLVKKLM